MPMSFIVIINEKIYIFGAVNEGIGNVPHKSNETFHFSSKFLSHYGVVFHPNVVCFDYSHYKLV